MVGYTIKFFTFEVQFEIWFNFKDNRTDLSDKFIQLNLINFVCVFLKMFYSSSNSIVIW